MPSIQKIVSPKTGEISWRAQVRVKGRPSQSETFPRQSEAKEWAASIETAIRQGKHFPHAAARRTSFDALVVDYLKAIEGEFDADELETRKLKLEWWAKHFAGKTVAEITTDVIATGRDALAAEPFTRSPRIPDAVKRKVSELKDAGMSQADIVAATGETVTTVRRVMSGKADSKEYKRSGATVNRYLAALSHALSFAKKERKLIDVNQMEDVTRRKELRGRTRFLSDEERKALLYACGQSDWLPLRSLVSLAIITGARRGELISLTWADVDMDAGRALVRESKNDEPRILPLAGKALDALRALKPQGAPNTAFVFPHPSGQSESFENFDSHWYKALERAGRTLNPDPDVKADKLPLSDFHFHDLRHTTASMLAAQGRSLLEIADVLGHKTLVMVKRYAHLVAAHKAKVIAEMVAAKGL
jgi:integrase